MTSQSSLEPWLLADNIEASCADPQSNQWNSESRKPTINRGILGLTERRRVVSTLVVRAASKEACHRY